VLPRGAQIALRPKLVQKILQQEVPCTEPNGPFESEDDVWEGTRGSSLDEDSESSSSFGDDSSDDGEQQGSRSCSFASSTSDSDHEFFPNPTVVISGTSTATTFGDHRKGGAGDQSKD
jgi:hypothetical protein